MSDKEEVKSTSKKVNAKKGCIGCSGIFVFFIILGVVIGALSPSEDVSNEESEAVEEKQDATEEVQEEQDQLEFKGNMDLRVEGQKVIMDITSNSPDGAIFELNLLNGNFDVLSDYVPSKEGKITKEFEIPDTWEASYISGMASFRFNLEDHPQPQHIKDVYGANGEKLTGELASENNLGGYNASFEPVTIAYPSEEVVKEKREKLLGEAINEMKEVSKGIIIDIGPMYDENDWSIVKVVISDAWYNSKEHEKERFAEQIGATVEELIKNAFGDETVQVYFVDSFGKDVATPKMFGGYEIQR